MSKYNVVQGFISYYLSKGQLTLIYYHTRTGVYIASLLQG